MDEGVSDFLNQAMEEVGVVVMLRMIIDQHQFTLSDLPKIGYKSSVSKILSGDVKERGGKGLECLHMSKLS
ncbi:Antitoxin HigA [Legionella brunensis]|uniref:Antitoxin HigA n=1 Tax=Legionella brunensis TaxID=29422 RepID=A0A0W0SKX4_9GAMM|nr:Antitoxin HigA [Legionella brunensis]